MNVVAILLAAGASRRFGEEDKLLAPYLGQPLAQHAVDALRPLALTNRIAVISNQALRSCLPGMDIVELDQGSAEQSASIRAGLTRAMEVNPDRILIVLADMPNVTSDLLSRIVDQSTTDMPAAATDGRRAMPPACFPPALYDQLTTLQGDKGARQILDTLPPAALVHAHRDELLDIDRQADLSALGKM